MTRGVLVMALLVACDARPKAADPAASPDPEPEMRYPDLPSAREPTECERLVTYLFEACIVPRISVDECEAIPAAGNPFGPRHRRVNDGTYYRFGRDWEWYAKPNGLVVAVSKAAEDACGGMATMADLVRGRALEAAEKMRDNDPTACSVGDIRRGQTIAEEIGVSRSEAEAFRAVAKQTRAPRADVEAVWSKVQRLCPEAI